MVAALNGVEPKTSGDSQMTARSDSQREAELKSLAKSDPDKLIRMWQEIAGVPAPTAKKEDLDLEKVVIPSLLAAEAKLRHRAQA